MANRDLDQTIASLALLTTKKLRELAPTVAEDWGPDRVVQLLDKLKKPGVTAEAAGQNAVFVGEWPWKWTATVIELLGALGPAGGAALWSLLEDPNDNIVQRALVVLLRMPATANDADRETLLEELRQRLPSFYRKDVALYPIVSSLLTEARSEPKLLEVLAALSELVLLDAKKKKFVLGDMARDILHSPVRSKPPELPEHKVLAEEFADAIVARDLKTVQGMLAPALRAKQTLNKLDAEFAGASSHSGWPTRHAEASFGGFRAEELRGSRSKHEPSLPKSIKDVDYRGWLWIEFLPDEDSDSDMAFKLGVALVDVGGELKIGYYWIKTDD